MQYNDISQSQKVNLALSDEKVIVDDDVERVQNNIMLICLSKLFDNHF